MCLTAKHNDTGIQTAAAPITVWKMLLVNNNRSPYQHRQYKPNQTAHTDRALVLKPWSIPDRLIVTHGLHAYTTYKRAKCAFNAGNFIGVPSLIKIVCMTIPVGAKYVIGIRDTIVANKMETGSLKGVMK